MHNILSEISSFHEFFSRIPKLLYSDYVTFNTALTRFRVIRLFSSQILNRYSNLENFIQKIYLQIYSFEMFWNVIQMLWKFIHFINCYQIISKFYPDLWHFSRFYETLSRFNEFSKIFYCKDVKKDNYFDNFIPNCI